MYLLPDSPLDQQLQGNRQTVVDFPVLTHEGLERQYCHGYFFMKEITGNCVTHENLITRRGRKGSLIKSCRFLFRDDSVGNCVECDFTLPLRTARWFHSLLSALFVSLRLVGFPSYADRFDGRDARGLQLRGHYWHARCVLFRALTVKFRLEKLLKWKHREVQPTKKAFYVFFVVENAF